MLGAMTSIAAPDVYRPWLAVVLVVTWTVVGALMLPAATTPRRPSATEAVDGAAADAGYWVAWAEAAAN